MRSSRAAVQLLAGISAGFAVGSLPSADVAAKLVGSGAGRAIDLRTEGSANPGAMNAGKMLGTKWGIAVMVADVAKGALASAIGRKLAGPAGANLAASAAVGGHCYPLGGRSGGKGVSTSIGQVIGTFPIYLPLDIAVAVATASLPRWTQRTWVATAVASGTWVASSMIAYRRGWPTGVDSSAPVSLPISAAISSAIIAKRFLDTPLIDGKPSADERVSSGTAEQRIPHTS